MGLKSYTSSYCALLLVVVIIISSCLVNWGQCYMIGNNPYHRAAYLDTQGMYYLEWRVDLQRKLITFNITTGTTGYVVFGLANNGSSSTGADIVIGGVHPNGQSYFSDRYSLGGNDIPQEDTSKQDDYVLHFATENKTHTTISFSRAWDTCDRLDYPITDNKLTVIWGYGVTDDYETVRIYGVQGSSSQYLLDPEYSPRISRDRRFNGQPSIVTRDNLQTWSIRRQIVIPDNATSYICSMHKAPRLQRKHHMVGIDVYFHSQGSRRRAHSFLIFKCSAPGGGDPRPLFEPFEGGQKESCFTPQTVQPSGSMPTHFCTELWTGWAIGGRSFFTPPHVGYPFGLSPDEYYMAQVIYDNPARSSGIIVDMRIDMFYTSNLRPNEAGMMGVGHENPAFPPSILLPPGTTNERVFSHCAPECTTRMYPESGIKVFAALMHTHNSGKRMRLRHFTREMDQELPWIVYDENYANNFQQVRHLKEEVPILPGDQLTMECIHDNTWHNSSTRQEVCISYIFYYNRISDYSFCRSEIISKEYQRRFLGVSNVTWVEDQLEWVAVTPRELAGLPMSEISNNYVNWDAGKRQELMRFHEAHPHVSKCTRDLAFWDPAQVRAIVANGPTGLSSNPPTSANTPNNYAGPASYPFKAKPYVPEQSCSYTSG